MSAPRGTSNGNAAGNSKARRARKVWLVKTYRADTDLVVITWSDTAELTFVEPEAGTDIAELVRDYQTLDSITSVVVEPACRCYRCGDLLTKDTVTADRIVPGDQKTTRYPKGGTYEHENIRPACGRCNSITGNQYRWAKVRAKQERLAKAAARRRAKRAQETAA